MGNKLYVGNIPFDTTEDLLSAIFAEGGKTVKKVNVIVDRETGKSRGFAFVIMGTDEEAQGAITTLDGREIGGRSMRVNEAQEKDRSQRGGGQNKGNSGYASRPVRDTETFNQSEFPPKDDSRRKVRKARKEQRRKEDGYGDY